MKKLYKFKWDCRYAFLGGLFVSTQEQIDAAMGKSIWLGGKAGKHSEIYGDLEEGDLTVMSEDQKFIEEFERTVGEHGFNPLKYISEQEQEN